MYCTTLALPQTSDVPCKGSALLLGCARTGFRKKTGFPVSRPPGHEGCLDSVCKGPFDQWPLRPPAALLLPPSSCVVKLSQKSRTWAAHVMPCPAPGLPTSFPPSTAYVWVKTSGRLTIAALPIVSSPCLPEASSAWRRHHMVSLGLLHVTTVTR